MKISLKQVEDAVDAVPEDFSGGVFRDVKDFVKKHPKVTTLIAASVVLPPLAYTAALYLISAVGFGYPGIGGGKNRGN
jgi:hypothetical protein